MPNGFYSVSDTQDYFEYILKNHGENTFKLHLKLKMGIALDF